MIYNGAFPDTLTNPEVKHLLEEYMRLSNANNPRHPHDADDEAFANLFTGDGVYQVGQRRAKGQKAIVDMRKALFSQIPHREHKGVKFFPFGSDQMHVMVEGEVDYEHHHGHKTSTSWAGRLAMKEAGGSVKFELLQIIVDTAAHN